MLTNVGSNEWKVNKDKDGEGNDKWPKDEIMCKLNQSPHCEKDRNVYYKLNTNIIGIKQTT